MVASFSTQQARQNIGVKVLRSKDHRAVPSGRVGAHDDKQIWKPGKHLVGIHIWSRLAEQEKEI